MSFLKKMFGRTAKAFKSRAPSVRNPTSFFTGRSTPTTRVLNKPRSPTNLSQAQAFNNMLVLSNRANQAEAKHELLDYKRIIKNILNKQSKEFGVNFKSPENFIKHLNKLQDKMVENQVASQKIKNYIDNMQQLMLGIPPPSGPDPLLPRIVLNSSAFGSMKQPPATEITNDEMSVLLGMKQPPATEITNEMLGYSSMKPPLRNNTKKPVGIPASRKTRRRY